MSAKAALLKHESGHELAIYQHVQLMYAVTTCHKQALGQNIQPTSKRRSSSMLGLSAYNSAILA